MSRIAFKTIQNLTIILFVLSASSILLAQDRTVVWDRWDVVIDEIDTTENRYDVREIYDVAFDGTFSFGQRVIPINNLDNIEDVTITVDGIELEESCSASAGTFCLRNTSDGKSIVYYFPRSITNDSADIEIAYTVKGALRSYEGGDQLWWSAIPEDHFGFPIMDSTVVVLMPPELTPREGTDPYVTYGVSTDMRICSAPENCPEIPWDELIGSQGFGGVAVVAEAQEPLRGNQSLEIRVQYPHDPDMITPLWQGSFDDQRNFQENVAPIVNLGSLLTGIVIAVVGGLFIIIRYLNYGRDPEVPFVPEYLTEPPSDLRPAVVGTLIDEHAEMVDILSTLIDLAQRGYLVIEEDKEAEVWGLFGSKSEYTFKRTNKSLDDLHPFERSFVNKFFAGKMTRSQSDLKNKFYRHLTDLQQDLYNELVYEKLFNSNPNSTRSMWFMLGVGLVILGGIVGFFVFRNFVDDLPLTIFLPISFVIVGAVAIFAARGMPAKTLHGAEEAAKWRAFKNWLENLEDYANVDSVADRFDQYLPYAIVFGIEKQWVSKFSSVPNMPIPYWYFPVYRGGYYSGGYRAGTPMPTAADVRPGDLASAGSGNVFDSVSGGLAGGLSSISDGLTDMFNSTSNALGSRPSGSGGRGGGSFSGGGFSGGGFSGGGSSGFG